MTKGGKWPFFEIAIFRQNPDCGFGWGRSEKKKLSKKTSDLVASSKKKITDGVQKLTETDYLGIRPFFCPCTVVITFFSGEYKTFQKWSWVDFFLRDHDKN